MLQTKKVAPFFEKSFTDKDGFIQIIIPSGVQKLESLYIEIKRKVIEQLFFTDFEYWFKIKTNFETPGSIIESSRQEPINNFTLDDSVRDLWVLMQAKYMKNVTDQIIQSIYYRFIIFSQKPT